jgi:hypothetical protein
VPEEETINRDFLHESGENITNLLRWQDIKQERNLQFLESQSKIEEVKKQTMGGNEKEQGKETNARGVRQVVDKFRSEGIPLEFSLPVPYKNENRINQISSRRRFQKIDVIPKEEQEY